MRILVCGGRDYSDRERVFAALDRLHESSPFTAIIQGAASGADALAAEWARERDVLALSYPANWRDLSHPDALILQDRHGRAYDARAGYRRNQIMIERGHPELVIAFPGGSGTKDMIERAKAAGIKVLQARHRPGECRERAPAAGKRGGKPVRVQYVRRKPLSSPNGLPTVYVGRPTCFGNPYKVGTANTPTRTDAVAAFRNYILARPTLMAKARAALRGKNLACWCPCDGQPCHADVLLEIANS